MIWNFEQSVPCKLLGEYIELTVSVLWPVCSLSCGYTKTGRSRALSLLCLIDFLCGWSPSSVTLVNLSGQSTTLSWHVFLLVVFLVTVHWFPGWTNILWLNLLRAQVVYFSFSHYNRYCHMVPRRTVRFSGSFSGMDDIAIKCYTV